METEESATAAVRQAHAAMAAFGAEDDYADDL